MIKKIFVRNFTALFNHNNILNLNLLQVVMNVMMYVLVIIVLHIMYVQ